MTYGIDWGDGRTTVIGADRAYTEQLLREASGPFLASNPSPSVIEIAQPTQHEEQLMSTPTPEQFLAQREAEDDQEDEDLESTPSDPLTSIAASLGYLAALASRMERENTDELSDQAQQDFAELEEAYNERQAEAERYADRLAQVLAICKPSTSKLANSIRAAIEPPAAPTPEPDARALQCAACERYFADRDLLDRHSCTAVAPAEDQTPASDAPVDEWRAFARSKGYTGPDVDQMNRSQIRTMLGIAHPEGDPS